MPGTLPKRILRAPSVLPPPPHLVDRLVGARVPQLKRPVCGKHQHRHAAQARLHDRGQQVCDRRATGRDHGRRPAARAAVAERPEAEGALVDANVDLGAGVARGGERERGRAGACARRGGGAEGRGLGWRGSSGGWLLSAEGLWLESLHAASRGGWCPAAPPKPAAQPRASPARRPRPAPHPPLTRRDTEHADTQPAQLLHQRRRPRQLRVRQLLQARPRCEQRLELARLEAQLLPLRLGVAAAHDADAGVRQEAVAPLLQRVAWCCCSTQWAVGVSPGGGGVQTSRGQVVSRCVWLQ